MRKFEVEVPGDPGSRTPYVSEEEAISFLDGVSDDTFERIMARFPWVSTRKLGMRKRYLDRHLWIVAEILSWEARPGPKGERQEKNAANSEKS